jgi:hypothetical protein
MKSQGKPKLGEFHSWALDLISGMDLATHIVMTTRRGPADPSIRGITRMSASAGKTC